MEHKRYIIKTVDDIVKIPTDRLPFFFADLAHYHEQLTQLQKSGIRVITGNFVWVDDGEIGVKLR